MSTLLKQLADVYLKGGAGSGNFGHSGRLGERGGSGNGGGNAINGVPDFPSEIQDKLERVAERRGDIHVDTLKLPYVEDVPAGGTDEPQKMVVNLRDISLNRDT